MAVPWLQIVQLVPSIVEVSRELLKKTKRNDLAPSPGGGADASVDVLLARIARLEENERKQAELVSEMAQQIAVLSRAAAALHQRAIWLAIGCSVAVAVAIGALIAAL